MTSVLSNSHKITPLAGIKARTQRTCFFYSLVEILATGFCQQDKHVQHENEVAFIFIFKLRRKNKVSRKNFLKFKNLPRSFLKTLKKLLM